VKCTPDAAKTGRVPTDGNVRVFAKPERWSSKLNVTRRKRSSYEEQQPEQRS
jgi:hypothetical protein